MSKPSFKTKPTADAIDLDEILAVKGAPARTAMLDPKVSADFHRNRQLLSKLNEERVEELHSEGIPSLQLASFTAALHAASL